MDKMEIESAVLAVVRDPDYRPVKPRGIAQRLPPPRPEAAEVRKAVKRLVARDELAYGSNHLVQAAAAVAKPKNTNQVLGVFRRNAKGYGFVRPAGQSPGEGRALDIYIPAEKTADASDGDMVSVRLQKHAVHGELGPRGEVVEVVERETHRFVGSYFESRGESFVAVDAGVFAHPIPVGDPGARDVRPNDKVVVEMVRFPSHVHQGEAVIVEVLGPRGVPGVDTLTILREYDLPEAFPEEVLEDSRRQSDRFDESIPPGRLDLTGLTTITIDPADARDFDDAISLERLDNGHWRLGVHIADVTHFVRPKTALDREARQRATSVYLPDRVLPMLPELISNALASIQPGRVRYTKTAFLEFTSDGLRTAADLRVSAIKSRHRFTYEQVDQYIADPQPWRTELEPSVFDLLGRMRELAAILRRRRFVRGALEMSVPEVKVDLDAEGRVCGAHVVENTESHQIIEEFMLAANETVAEVLRDRGFLFLRRVHRPPTLKRLKALSEFVAELGLPAEIPTGDLESRFALQQLLNEVAAARAACGELFGAAFDAEGRLQPGGRGPLRPGQQLLLPFHVSHPPLPGPDRPSPDRRVPFRRETPQRHGGITRARRALLAARAAGRSGGTGVHENETPQLSEHPHRRGNGSGDHGRGVFWTLCPGDSPARRRADPRRLAHRRLLPLRPRAHTLAGHRAGNSFRLGDPVRVAIVRVDADRRELDFRLIQRQPRPKSAGRSGGERRKKAARGKPAKGTKKKRTGRKAP